MFLVDPRDSVCVHFTVACHVLSHAGNLWQRHWVTPRQRASPAEPCHRVPLGWFLKGRPSLVLHVVRLVSSKHFLETSPLRNDGGFWRSIARPNQVERHRGFLLHTVTRLLRPQLTHYYGIICHLTPRRLLLELPLEVALPASHASLMGELTRPG